MNQNNSETIQKITYDDLNTNIFCTFKDAEINGRQPIFETKSKNGNKVINTIVPLNRASVEDQEDIFKEAKKRVLNFKKKNGISLKVQNSANALTYSATPYDYVDFNDVVLPIVVKYPQVNTHDPLTNRPSRRQLTQGDFLTAVRRNELGFMDRYTFFNENIIGNSDQMLDGYISAQTSLSEKDFVSADFGRTPQSVKLHLFGYKASQNFMEYERVKKYPGAIDILQKRFEYQREQEAKREAESTITGLSNVVLGFGNNTNFATDINTLIPYDLQSPTVTFKQMSDVINNIRVASLINNSSYTLNTFIMPESVVGNLQKQIIKSEDIPIAIAANGPGAIPGFTYLGYFIEALYGMNIDVLPVPKFNITNSTTQNAIYFLYNKQSVQKIYTLDNLLITQTEMYMNGQMNQTAYYLNGFSDLKIERPSAQYQIIFNPTL